MDRILTSWTAQGTAAMRAIESEKPANTRICYDPLARQFVKTWFYYLIKLLAGYGERRTHGALKFIVCRCRYFDDYLQACLESGFSQVMILGAGLDSRAYRDGLLSGGVKTFEVDHPATQASKLKRLKTVLPNISNQMTYVPIDFNDEGLDKLLANGYDPARKTLFIWEGVTQYLRPEGVDVTLGWVRADAAQGSSIIFDYQDTAGLPQTKFRRGRLYDVLTHFTGERRDFGIAHSQIETFMRERGFSQVVDVNAERLQGLYCTGANQGRRVADNYAIVHVEIV
jgi:methyltransferase (TIGR00027 family)